MRCSAQGFVAVAARIALLGVALGATAPALAQDAVCAQVKIEIKQKLSLERQAFDAVMRINNGLDTASIQGIGINLTFEDDLGNPVVATSDPANTSASFFLRVDSLTGINAIDGSGAVAPKTTGEIHWLIIPAQGTGGVQPQGKLYFVGASLTYSVFGATTTLAVTPDFITVKPQPLLALDYFLAGDVYADDPFTPAVEPAEPFTLGVRIKNVGGGTAAKTSIESAQPKIVENTQGLLIGFQILDSYVNDQPAGKTLLINFGDIGPGASMVGRWNMVTTLSGKFIDLVAGYTHADSLGGALTSLIQGVSTHLLVHDVKADLPGRDTVRDFLALDGNVLRLYESEGTDTVVIDQSTNARLTAVPGGSYDLAFPPTTGFAFVKLSDPFGGQAQPASVVRSDGKVVPPENVWLSKTRNANLTWSYAVNFFDANTTGLYSVRFSAGTFVSIAGFVYADANDNGTKDAGESGLGVTPVTLTGTDDQGLSVNQTAFAAPDGSWSLVQRPGNYSLKVGAVTGYVDGKVKAGTAGGTVAGDTISGIVLGAGAQATGYLFAKTVSAPPPTQADLALTMTASATTAPVGGNVTFTITVANAGPALATGTRVNDVLPSTLSLVSAAATPGAGAYDGATGVWTIGNLAAGANATLTIVVKVTSIAQPIVNSATAVSALNDPNAADNTASVTLNPEAGTLGITQTIPRESRVLAFVGCPGTTATGNPACTSARANFLATYLAGLGYDASVVTSVETFMTSLRSGRYNTYWISADDAMSSLVMSEVREAVLRGDTLVFDGPDGSATTPLEGATGVTSGKQSVGTGVAIDLIAGASAVAAANSIATVGDDRKLSLRGGTVRATFVPSGKSNTKDSAIVDLRFGNGYGIVTAFDLLGTLQLPASEAALRPLIVEILTTGAPAVPAAFVGDAYVPITTEVSNLAGNATVEVTTTLAGGLAMADANPPPVSVTGNDVTWRFGLAPNATQFIDLGVRVPLASASYPVQTTVSKVQGGATTPYNTFPFTIPVTGSDQFGAQLIADLNALVLTAGNERKARDNAVAALQNARTAIAANQFDVALGNFVSASDAIGSLSAIDPMPFRVVASKWLQETEQRWYLGLPVCGVAVSAPTLTAGTSFAPFDPAEGLEVRGGRSAKGQQDWAWSLGADRQSSGKSVQQSLAWVSSKLYGWTLTYDGQGGGSYTVTDTLSTLFARTYSGAAKLDAGDTLKLSVGAKPEAASGRIDATVQSVNGKPVGSNQTAVGVPGGSSSLYLYYPAMTSGFQLAGSIRLTFPLVDALVDDRLDFTVTSGNSLCRAPKP